MSRIRDKNTVYIGNKPVMNYVLACITLFHSGVDEVSIKARGRAVSRAVDVAEITRNRFVPNATIKDVKIGTEQITTHDGAIISISTIDIILGK